jgi:hypothetical protein
MSSKLIPHKVTIESCDKGYGFYYKGECFAYVWAMPAFSPGWWKNLLLFSNRSNQDLLMAGERIKKATSRHHSISLPVPHSI